MSVLAKKEEIKKELETSPDLKCMPFIATEIIRLVDDAQTTSRELRSLISTDASLTGRILKIVNSAQYAMTRKVSELAQAITLLGFNQVKEIVLIASTEVMRSSPAATELFKFNLLTANLAKFICKPLDDFQLTESAFIGGLLQGVGKCFYLERYEKDYIPLLIKPEEQRREFEISLFGLPSEKVSYELLKGWDLSEDIAQAALNAKNPPHKHSSELEAAIYLACQLAKFDLDDGLDSKYLLSLDKEMLAKLKIKAPELRGIFEAAAESYKTTMATFE